jgi:hypothetical protein
VYVVIQYVEYRLLGGTIFVWKNLLTLVATSPPRFDYRPNYYPMLSLVLHLCNSRVSGINATVIKVLNGQFGVWARVKYLDLTLWGCFSAENTPSHDPLDKIRILSAARTTSPETYFILYPRGTVSCFMFVSHRVSDSRDISLVPRRKITNQRESQPRERIRVESSQRASKVWYETSFMWWVKGCAAT